MGFVLRDLWLLRWSFQSQALRNDTGIAKYFYYKLLTNVCLLNIYNGSNYSSKFLSKYIHTYHMLYVLCIYITYTCIYLHFALF